MTFADALKKAQEKRLEKTDHADVEVELGGEVVTLRFRRMEGLDWVGLTAKCPPRPDAPIDVRFGYNVHAAAQLAAPKSGVVVEGADEVALDDEQWADVWPVLSGPAFADIADAIFTLNQWTPQGRVEAIKKASRANSLRSQLSRANSESPSAGSGVGSPRKSSRSSGTKKAASPGS